MNSCAAARTLFRSARSSRKKMACRPVSLCSWAIAARAFASFREAMYTVALCLSSACKPQSVH